MSFLKETSSADEPIYLQQSVQPEPRPLKAPGNQCATDDSCDFLNRDGSSWQFQPPGRLYGRDRQQQELMEAYEKTKTRQKDDWNSVAQFAIRLEGPSGVGKTSLALSLRPIVEADGGYFIQGKFDRRPEPHAVLISALSGFAETVVSRGDGEMARISDALSCLDADEKKILVEIIPALQTILHASSPERIVQPLKLGLEASAESMNRFKQATQKLVRSVACPYRPLVFLVDDFHWADESSVDLLRSLFTDSSISGALFLLTVRETVSDLRAYNYCQADIPSTILKPLSKEDVALMLREILECDPDQAQPLVSFIYSKTSGHPWSIAEYLCALSEGGCLRYKDGCVSWDMDEVTVKFGGDETDFVVKKVTELSARSQELLKIASCVGSRIAVETLKHFVADDSEMDAFLAEIQGKALVTFDRDYVSFAHDYIHEAVYNQLITVADRGKLHHKIGRQLWRDFDMETLDRRLFLVVGQLMMAHSDMKEQKERNAVARLCLRAAVKAVFLSNFHTAHCYLSHGISLLDERAWRNEYELSLSLHNAAAEIAYSAGYSKNVFPLVDAVLGNARCFDDSIHARTVQIYALGGSGQVQAATKASLDLLKSLGESIPAKPTVFHILLGVRKINKMLKMRSFEAILRLPSMDDPRKQAAMQVLNQMFIYSYLDGGNRMAAMVCFQMVILTLRCGLSPISCIGFTIYAAGACHVSVEAGYRLGQLASDLYDKFKAKPYLARYTALYVEGIHCWKRSFQSGLQQLTDASRAGLETGDIEFGCACFCFQWAGRYFFTPLRQLDVQMQEFYRHKDFMKKQVMGKVVQGLWQMAHNLMGKSVGDPSQLHGRIMDETEIGESCAVSSMVYSAMCFPRMVVCFMFGHFEKAAKFAKESRLVSSSHFSPMMISLVTTFDALTVIAMARKHSRRRSRWAKKISKKLWRWSSHAPENYLGVHLLIEAELASLANDHVSALPMYENAIAGFERQGFICHAALANELCGKYMIARGDMERAEMYSRNAVLGYTRWDAQALAQKLAAELRQYNFESLKCLT